MTDDGHSSACDMASIPIDFDDADLIKCNLCGHTATEDSPLTTSTSLVLSRGKWPWNYRKIKDSETGEVMSRKPVGKYCRCCNNSFGCRGLHRKHTNISEYYKHLCKPENTQESRGFAIATQEWINSVNKDGSTTRIKNKDDFNNRITKLTSEKVETTGFRGPDWDFVCKENWEAHLDGEYDALKAEKREVFGVEREGCWVRRGREGVYRYQHKEGTTVRRKTLEDDGSGPFADASIQNKLDVIRSGQVAFEKNRALKNIVAPPR